MRAPSLWLMCALVLVLQLLVAEAIFRLSTEHQSERRELRKNVTGIVPAHNEWLTNAFTYPVEKVDKYARFRISSLSHTNTVNKFLLHVTGGYTLAGETTLDGKKSWPHFFVCKNETGTAVVKQFVSLKSASRALIRDNRKGVIQVEICVDSFPLKNPATKKLYKPRRYPAPFTSDPVLADAVRSVYHAVRAEFPTIPNQAPLEFEVSSFEWKVRLKTEPEFVTLAGLVGHQHVPAGPPGTPPDKIEDHGDPGKIDTAVMLALPAVCTASPPAPNCPSP